MVRKGWAMPRRRVGHNKIALLWTLIRLRVAG
jgi:hypothetical protein